MEKINTHTLRFLLAGFFLMMVLAACQGSAFLHSETSTSTLAPVETSLSATQIPTIAPSAAPTYQPAEVDARVHALLAQMTLEEKVGQMTQVGASMLRNPSDLITYHLGSVLSGGDDNPYPNTPIGWADLYDRLQTIALTSRLGIPLLYGIDSVHGFNHTFGTTIFPHHIGIGATRDPVLVEQVGRITALEMSGTGVRWTFGPCLCVARNERWGRTYECFGEDPALVSQMAVEIRGLQGDDLSLPTSVLATAKHYLGDGGTSGGVDRGNTLADAPTLRKLFLAPYQSAIQYHVGSIMVSFSSINGAPMHGSQSLITGVLKGELDFDGLVVSDWHGINDTLPGSYAEKVRAGVNAGIDLFMQPDDYVAFYNALLSEVQAGRIAPSRIDDAVTRILRIKVRMGLFEHPLASRANLDQIGSADHRAIARQAVRESVVLLKNDQHILPLPKNGKRILVAGKNADDLGAQIGGWGSTWQGQSGNITTGTTILQAIRTAVSDPNQIIYDPDAMNLNGSYDVAVVAIGEKPYAEFLGDRPNPGDLNLDSEDVAVLERIHAKGIPIVAVLISGRPLIMTQQLSDWAALLAAWLPGTEGEGVVDVLFGDYPPTGKLPITWPRTDSQIPSHPGDAGYDPLFPYGFGLTY
jgi:beta-glucosidase